MKVYKRRRTDRDGSQKKKKPKTKKKKNKNQKGETPALPLPVPDSQPYTYALQLHSSPTIILLPHHQPLSNPVAPLPTTIPVGRTSWNTISLSLQYHWAFTAKIRDFGLVCEFGEGLLPSLSLEINYYRFESPSCSYLSVFLVCKKGVIVWMADSISEKQNGEDGGRIFQLWSYLHVLILFLFLLVHPWM